MDDIGSFYSRRGTRRGNLPWSRDLHHVADRLPDMSPERVISISISEADWKTLRTIQPEPVDWLKGKIRETVEQARQAAAGEPQRSRTASH